MTIVTDFNNYLRLVRRGLRNRRRLMHVVGHLRDIGDQVAFPADGGVSITLPSVSRRLLWSGHGRELTDQLMSFSGRPQAEPLLRRIVAYMYDSAVLSISDSVVDIGAWLGDNSLIWARKLTGEGIVIAIDPSPRNLGFIALLARTNRIRNIHLFEGVCADSSGQLLSFEGPLTHASFQTEGDSSTTTLRSTTIDAIVGQADWPSVGLLHVDVEGFEAKVLVGAEKTISLYKPVIIFEHHIRDRNGLDEICQWLVSRDYDVFMINEVLAGCLPDCRNFLAVSCDVSEALALLRGECTDSASEHFPAVPGPWLIPLP